jgi:hypothetical protein
MKKILFAATMVVALTLTAAAAGKKPAPAANPNGHGTVPTQLAPHGIPPALCKPCLFYGGDLDPSAGTAEGFSDENTLLVTGSSTYASFNVPTGAQAKITGILFNLQADANFDPNTATYDIRSGVSSGNGGTEIASGSGTISVATTGRIFIGLTEFTVLVTLTTPVSLTAGEYWFNITPTCTNGAVDGSCYVGRMFLSNTTSGTNNVDGQAQSGSSLFLNSSFFGFTYEPWCSLVVVQGQCHLASFGLTGYRRKQP